MSDTLKNLLAAVGALFLILVVICLLIALFTDVKILGFAKKIEVVGVEVGEGGEELERIELEIRLEKDDPEEKKIGITIRGVGKGPEEEAPEAGIPEAGIKDTPDEAGPGKKGN